MPAISIFTQVKASLEELDVTLVAVSKTQSNVHIMRRYELGQRIFGENRVQELAQKQATLPKDIIWHQIGHLQTNKVKVIAPFIALIHAGDSLKILRKINDEALRCNRIIDVLLQAKVAQEDAKFGFDLVELANEALLKEIAALPNVQICGLMGMASFVADEEQIKLEFRTLKNLFDTLKDSHHFNQESFQFLSMGMSGDYALAISEGSNMVRIGSLIF